MDRHLGTFEISWRDIHAHPELVRQALSGLIVVRAEMRYDIEGVEYTALGAEFSEVPAHRQVPRYWLVVDENGPAFRPERP